MQLKFRRESREDYAEVGGARWGQNYRIVKVLCSLGYFVSISPDAQKQGTELAQGRDKPLKSYRPVP